MKKCTHEQIRPVVNVNQYLASTVWVRYGRDMASDVQCNTSPMLYTGGSAHHTRPARGTEIRGPYRSRSMAAGVGFTTEPYHSHNQLRPCSYLSHIVDRYGKSVARSMFYHCKSFTLIPFFFSSSRVEMLSVFLFFFPPIVFLFTVRFTRVVMIPLHPGIQQRFKFFYGSGGDELGRDCSTRC